MLADAFSPPDAAKVRILEEMKPCFLEGSRGTGKTMLLLSLRSRIYISRSDSSRSLNDLFGCYVRLERGAYCNAGLRVMAEGSDTAVDHALLMQLTDTFAQEFYLSILESMVSEVAYCITTHSLALDAAGESSLIHAIMQALYGPRP